MITAYQFAKTVNTLIATTGVEKALPPQMFYTYYKKGFIKADQQTQAGAVAWTEKYLRKHYPEIFEATTTTEDTIKVDSERVEILSINA